MATSKGRKSAAKKKEKETAVESPKKEVIEPKVEAPKAAAPKKAVKKVEPKPVQEELPPPPPPAPEPAPVVEPVVEEQKQELPDPPAPRIVEVGSLVIMPSGKRGTVIAVNRKGYFEVRSERNPRKTYLYEPSQLSLV